MKNKFILALVLTTFAFLPSPFIKQAKAVRPDLPDLDVLFIERLPRYDFDAAKKWPNQGEEVEFKAYVKNNGTQPTGNFDYEWKIDGNRVASGSLSSLAPNQETTISYRWPWAHTTSPDERIQGSHTIELVVDPANPIQEISENNNKVTDFTQALAVGFWVEQAVYDFFNTNQYEYCQGKTCNGSSSWEDWAQRQTREWNKIFDQSRYASYPNGVLDRVRLDKVIVVPNCALPLAGGIADNQPDKRDRTVDLMWGFTSAKVGIIACQRDEADGNKYLYQNNPRFQNIEYPLMHELSHARYLIDTYCWNIRAEDVSVTDDQGIRIAGTPLLPLVRDNLVYLNKDQKMMGGGVYEDGYGEHSVGALNRVWWLRARGGNYNAPSVIGEYLNDLPSINRFHFLSLEGKSLDRAGIIVYQSLPSPGYCGRNYDDTPDINITADPNGQVDIGRNPFSRRSGVDNYNAIFLFRINYRNQKQYRFQEVSDFNLAYWRGEKGQANYSIQTGITACPSHQNGNLDCDALGLINNADLEALYGDWDPVGPIPTPAIGELPNDLHPDGKIDEKDFLILLSHWNNTQ